MTRLTQNMLASLPRHIARPAYDRSALATGIVHFGPGAFHRAHQADYIDRLLAYDRRWGVAAVSLRSAGTVEELARQDGLYTLAILDETPSFRVLGPHVRFLGPGNLEEVAGLLADPGVRLVSSTVTEKGYCLAADGALDFDHPDVVRDLRDPRRPRSLVGWITLGLAARKEARLPPFAVLCCDNMPDNGRKLAAAVSAFAGRFDADLAAWIEGEAIFPNTMVDSITPATDDTTRGEVESAIGLTDAIPVRREAYSAWIVEDVLPDSAPDLAAARAVLTADVAAYERAKLRILNGAHSSLAYLGLLLGHETVSGAMADARLSSFIERLVRSDIVPSLAPSSIDLDAYAGEVLRRFRNPAIGHKLEQIAWDGSQKLAYRLLDAIGEALDSGRSVERLAIPVAGWMLFIEREARAGQAIVDPLADRLVRIGRSAGAPEQLLALAQIFPDRLAKNSAFRVSLLAAVEAMRTDPAALLGG